MRKRVFSGIQPTGLVHIGNYLGALKNWAAMQDEYDCVYCIVDLHALTIPQNPEEFRQNILLTAAATIASGIDPKRSILFVQSDVPEHSELCWILNCFVYFGELNRMTQFKDKSAVRGQGASAGLFNYPALMAADILLYDTNAVPVGDDQKQHLELTRMLARRLNNDYPNLFVVPDPFIGKAGARIMGLDDPAVKMSKSAKSEYNYVSLMDPPDKIRKKIMKAVTDSGTEIQYEPAQKPALANLLNIYSVVSDEPVDKIVERFHGKGYSDFKKELAEVLIEKLAPVQKKFTDLQADLEKVQRLLEEGAQRARDRARPKMQEIRQRMGLGH
ncbi:MAG: tryptophan--tRNA ligase [Elusimicrobia bacterium]|nr:tryptophan--tRNA ligase [Candidatus Obscuribacterium magneticum]